MKPQSVYQLSVVISPEAEEAVGELLFRLFDTPATGYMDVIKQVGVSSVYLPMNRKPTRKQLADVQEGLRRIAECGLEIGAGEIHVQLLKGSDWMESWKRHFVPIDIGGRLLIKPGWEKRRAKKGQHEVILDPGISFGTGHHATTSFCLQQLVAHRVGDRRQSFLDIGCGSGILGIAAAKLGFAPIVCFDFNADSVRSARENSVRNHVAETVRPTQKDLTRLPINTARRYDIVCANLIYDLLIAERERIVNRLADDGVLVLAGILETQFPKVKRAFHQIGMKLIESQVGGEWQSGAFARRLTA